MSSADRLIAMINEKNASLAVPLDRTNVVFDDVNVDPESGWNTRIMTRAVAGRDYSGAVEVFVTRVNLTALGTKLELTQEDPFTVSSMLEKINVLRNAQLGLEDLTIESIPFMNPLEVNTFTISAEPDSLVWIGNTQVSLLTGLPDEADNLATFLNVTLPALFA